jgi:hypothetical protein
VIWIAVTASFGVGLIVGRHLGFRQAVRIYLDHVKRSA